MRNARLPQLVPVLFAAMAALIAPALADDAADEARGDQVTLGYIENVAVGNLALAMKGKLDTGADTSSVHAYNVKVYKRGERDNWVRFRLIGKDGRAIRYDQNVIRFAAIKTKTGGIIRRPVIHLPLCVGGKWGRAEINLADRGDFEYEILIGREFLANRVLVDASRTFTAEEECEPPNED
ncbi:MAG: hypothetical protein CMI63_08950 [Parvularcula sp.]|uniref:ATP-dependent zinc protease family protein n=1 Tax=Hyphococcus sp. TaxID=2038636 RepID=UPI000C5A4DFA|nr:hypothetical protein [Parvularcula sp.]